MRTNQIYVGIKGTVLALDRDSGSILWQTSVGGWQFVSIVDDGDRVFVLSHGEAYCLDARNGSVLWHNPLKGFGYGIASLSIAGRRGCGAETAAQIAADESSSSSDTSSAS